MAYLLFNFLFLSGCNTAGQYPTHQQSVALYKQHQKRSSYENLPPQNLSSNTFLTEKPALRQTTYGRRDVNRLRFEGKAVTGFRSYTECPGHPLYRRPSVALLTWSDLTYGLEHLSPGSKTPFLVLQARLFIPKGSGWNPYDTPSSVWTVREKKNPRVDQKFNR